MSCTCAGFIPSNSELKFWIGRNPTEAEPTLPDIGIPYQGIYALYPDFVDNPGYSASTNPRIEDSFAWPAGFIYWKMFSGSRVGQNL
jgi:hypothetical protein